MAVQESSTRKPAPTSTSSLQAGSIWLDGELVQQEEAKVSVLTHALHYGTSVFEGIRRLRDRARRGGVSLTRTQ